MSIPVPLPPDIPGLDVTVARVESLRPDMPVPVAMGGAVKGWREVLEGEAAVQIAASDGTPVMMGENGRFYLGGWPDADLLALILTGLLTDAGLKVRNLPPDIRLRQAGDTQFLFNHGPDPVTHEGREIPAAGVLWHRRD